MSSDSGARLGQPAQPGGLYRAVVMRGGIALRERLVGEARIREMTEE